MGRMMRIACTLLVACAPRLPHVTGRLYVDGYGNRLLVTPSGWYTLHLSKRVSIPTCAVAGGWLSHPGAPLRYSPLPNRSYAVFFEETWFTITGGRLRCSPGHEPSLHMGTQWLSDGALYVSVRHLGGAGMGIGWDAEGHIRFMQSEPYEWLRATELDKEPRWERFARRHAIAAGVSEYGPSWCDHYAPDVDGWNTCPAKPHGALHWVSGYRGATGTTAQLLVPPGGVLELVVKGLPTDLELAVVGSLRGDVVVQPIR